MLTFWWHQRKSQGITKVIRMYHLGTMNVCTIEIIEIFQSLDQSGLTDQQSHACNMATNKTGTKGIKLHESFLYSM